MMQDLDLGISLYEMEQINTGTSQVQEVWKKLTLSANGTTINRIPCNN